jgi:hypothetical protein
MYNIYSHGLFFNFFILNIKTLNIFFKKISGLFGLIHVNSCNSTTWPGQPPDGFENYGFNPCLTQWVGSVYAIWQRGLLYHDPVAQFKTWYALKKFKDIVIPTLTFFDQAQTWNNKYQRKKSQKKRGRVKVAKWKANAILNRHHQSSLTR